MRGTGACWPAAGRVGQVPGYLSSEQYAASSVQGQSAGRCHICHYKEGWARPPCCHVILLFWRLVIQESQGAIRSYLLCSSMRPSSPGRPGGGSHSRSQLDAFGSCETGNMQRRCEEWRPRACREGHGRDLTPSMHRCPMPWFVRVRWFQTSSTPASLLSLQTHSEEAFCCKLGGDRY